MGGNEYIVLNGRVMTDVIATPQDHVCTDFHERLKDIVFEYKAVLAKLNIFPHERMWTDERGRVVASGLRRQIQTSAEAVQLSVNARNEKGMSGWREPLFQSLECNDREAKHFVLLEKRALNRKSNNFINRFAVEILV